MNKNLTMVAALAVPIMFGVALSFTGCDGSSQTTGCGDGPACEEGLCCVDGTCGTCTDGGMCPGPDCPDMCDCPDDGNACTAEKCDEAGACLHEPVAAGTVCRAAIGACDVEEACDGTEAECPVDQFDAACECPENGPIDGYAEHDGLRPIDYSGFALVDTNTWEDSDAHWASLGLPVVALSDLPLDKTATAPAGALATALSGMVAYSGGFEWAVEDQTVTYWIPQGLTGGVAGTAKQMVAVSWHYDESLIADDPSPPAIGDDKGVRISFADVSKLGGDVPYTHVLLARSDSATGFTEVPLQAGGIAWVGRYLYVAETAKGFRVFDMNQIMQVSTAPECAVAIGKLGDQYCAYGLPYILPQVGTFYFPDGALNTCEPKISFVSADFTSDPPSLVSGEFQDSSTTGLYSRLIRWPLDSKTAKLLVGSSGTVRPMGAWYAGNRNLQGVAAVNDKFFLNSTRSTGELYSGGENEPSMVYAASTGAWAWRPGGIHHSNGDLWVVTEGHTDMARVVFYAPAANIP